MKCCGSVKLCKVLWWRGIDLLGKVVVRISCEL